MILAAVFVGQPFPVAWGTSVVTNLSRQRHIVDNGERVASYFSISVVNLQGGAVIADMPPACAKRLRPTAWGAVSSGAIAARCRSARNAVWGMVCTPRSFSLYLYLSQT